jgi:hypothetical protein
MPDAAVSRLSRINLPYTGFPVGFRGKKLSGTNSHRDEGGT